MPPNTGAPVLQAPLCNPDAIPAELKQLDRWVNWGVNTQKPKIPYNPDTLLPAKTGEPGTWSTFQKAMSRVRLGQAQGVGFQFHDDGLIGVDLDKVITDGVLLPEAQEIVAQLDSYTEISPSGTGLHILVRAEGFALHANRRGFVEMYDRGRYFTVTGNVYGEPKPIAERTDALQQVYEKYLSDPSAQPPSVKSTAPTSRTDEDYLRVGLEKDDLLKRLYGGARPHGNESQDDQALLNKLAYWTNGNASLIESAFKASPYFQGKDADHRKKAGRADYLQRTIQKAIDGLTATAQQDDARYHSKHPALNTGSVPVIPNQEDSDKPSKPTAIQFINPFSDKTRYRLNDVGMGNLFADTFKDICRYASDVKQWYCYDGRIWQQDFEALTAGEHAKAMVEYMLHLAFDIGDIHEQTAFLKFVARITTTSGRKNILDDARGVHPVAMKRFDSQPFLLNCQNGTLDLRTGELRSHSPADMITKILNAAYDPGARCERWASFIDEIMQGDRETAKFMQKAFGYCLTADTSRECFFVLYGPKTRNGKGTLTETLMELFGDYGKTAQAETITSKQEGSGGEASEDIARLKGARIVHIDEPEKGLRLNSALIKHLTGGGARTARFLHQNSFQFVPEFKLFINTNHLPKITDDTVFSSDRVKVIPFTRYFEEHERDLGLKAFFRKPENLSGILNWLLEGLRLLNEEGLSLPNPVERAVAEYREESDVLGAFIKEKMTVRNGGKIKTKDVYAAYEGWCFLNGNKPLSSISLIAELRKRELVKRDRDLGNIVYGYALIPKWEQQRETWD